MNILHDIFNRFLMKFFIVSDLLLETKNCNMIRMIISSIHLNKNDTEQM
jgi:hypothetical protein